MRNTVRKLSLVLILPILFSVCISCGSPSVSAYAEEGNFIEAEEKDFIKWVDLNVGAKLLKKVYSLDKKYRGTDIDFDFCEALAYLATKNGNKFSDKSDFAALDKLVKELESGKKISDFYGENKYYKYYCEAYSAIFSEMIGEYKTSDGAETEYGIKAFFPLADGFWYNHYDDFGTSRSYGFKRRHLGHDIMGSVGTPIIAMEGGTVAELGWNRYGGWRIGIRSHDEKRYYYYAHLRKDKPFAADLAIGDTVVAGQVIGYLGMTGYSAKENVNLKSGKPHLHVGLQLIFDESQVSGSKEIWVDMYGICGFLSGCRAKVQKDAETKEYTSLNTKISLTDR